VESAVRDALFRFLSRSILNVFLNWMVDSFKKRHFGVFWNNIIVVFVYLGTKSAFFKHFCWDGFGFCLFLVSRRQIFVARIWDLKRFWKKRVVSKSLLFHSLGDSSLIIEIKSIVYFNICKLTFGWDFRRKRVDLRFFLYFINLEMHSFFGLEFLLYLIPFLHI